MNNRQKGRLLTTMHWMTSLSFAAFHPLEQLGLSPAVFTLGLVIVLLLLLAFSTLAPDIILILGVLVLLLTGVLSPADGLIGLSNEAVVTVGLLYVVGAGVRETGGVDWIAKSLFGRPKTVIGAIVRLVFPTMGLSA